MLDKPTFDVERVVLLRPQHSAEGLAHDEFLVVAVLVTDDVLPELVGLLAPRLHRLVEPREGSVLQVDHSGRGELSVG